jgi:hypothetical protein
MPSVQKFLVGDAGNGSFYTQIFGNDGRSQVYLFQIGGGNEQVSFPHIGILQYFIRSRTALDGSHIYLVANLPEPFCIRIDNGNILIFVR